MYMRIGTSTAQADYFIDEQCIAKVNSVKDLGFIYDVKLDFSGQVKMLHSKGLARLHQIFKGLVTKDKKVLTVAYKTYVRSIVEFGSIVFSPYKKKYTAMLERVQKKFTRWALIRVGFALLDSKGQYKE